MLKNPKMFMILIILIILIIVTIVLIVYRCNNNICVGSTLSRSVVEGTILDNVVQGRNPVENVPPEVPNNVPQYINTVYDSTPVHIPPRAQEIAQTIRDEQDREEERLDRIEILRREEQERLQTIMREERQRVREDARIEKLRIERLRREEREIARRDAIIRRIRWWNGLG